MNAKNNPNTPELWDELLFSQDENLKKSPIYRDKLRKVAKYITKHPGKMLDIGFGMGNLEHLLFKNNLDLEFYGIDISVKAVRNIKTSIKGDFKVGSIFKLPFKEGFFDSVVILDVLEHIEKEKILLALHEVFRILKKGGALIVSVPLNENLKKLNREGKNYNAHLREYTLKILSSELKNSGFTVLDYKYLTAFKSHYYLKTLVSRIFTDYRKPNLLILYAVRL